MQQLSSMQPLWVDKREVQIMWMVEQVALINQGEFITLFVALVEGIILVLQVPQAHGRLKILVQIVT